MSVPVAPVLADDAAQRRVLPLDAFAAAARATVAPWLGVDDVAGALAALGVAGVLEVGIDAALAVAGGYGGPAERVSARRAVVAWRAFADEVARVDLVLAVALLRHRRALEVLAAAERDLSDDRLLRAARRGDIRIVPAGESGAEAAGVVELRRGDRLIWRPLRSAA